MCLLCDQILTVRRVWTRAGQSNRWSSPRRSCQPTALRSMVQSCSQSSWRSWLLLLRSTLSSHTSPWRSSRGLPACLTHLQCLKNLSIMNFVSFPALIDFKIPLVWMDNELLNLCFVFTKRSHYLKFKDFHMNQKKHSLFLWKHHKPLPLVA